MTDRVSRKYIQEITIKYKNYLKQTPRYERFMDGENISKWISILGPDVLLLTHGEVTADIAEEFVQYNETKGIKLTKEEKYQLLLVPYIHDWGEIIIEDEGVGDVTFDDKNDTAEAVEGIIFNKVVSSIKDELIKEKFHIAYQNVVMKRDTKLGEMFNAIERIGYLKTAIKAFAGSDDKSRIKNWKGLVGNVLSNQIQKLLEYSKKYPYVYSFLEEEKENIQSMFDGTINIKVPYDNKDKLSFDAEKLNNAYDIWKKTFTV